jgi:uncharacterized membrane protein YqaE (UPF0057 family)
MLYLIAILFPPLAVLLCGKPFQAMLNLFLCLLLWLPGLIHACLVVSQYHADCRSNNEMDYQRKLLQWQMEQTKR